MSILGSPKSAPRAYHSPARAQRASATREVIAEAARALFRSRGYRGTTVRAIADAARVAPQTVYFVFGSKRGILTDLVRRAKEMAAVGDTYAQIPGEADARRQLALSIEITARWAEAAAELVDLVRAEASSDADVADAWRSVEESRHHGNAEMVQWLAARGALRPGITVEQATDLLWTLESTDLYRLLVVERGWATELYVAELTTLLALALLR